jgi:hypothetical protein
VYLDKRRTRIVVLVSTACDGKECDRARRPTHQQQRVGPNLNKTVIRMINESTEFHGKAAVYRTCKTFKEIFNQPRSVLQMQVGWDLPTTGSQLQPRQELLNELYRATTRLDDEDVWDSFEQIALIDYVKSAHPKLLFVGYGETDNWVHSGRYDLVLESAHHVDERLFLTMKTRIALNSDAQNILPINAHVAEHTLAVEAQGQTPDETADETTAPLLGNRRVHDLQGSDNPGLAPVSPRRTS